MSKPGWWYVAITTLSIFCGGARGDSLVFNFGGTATSWNGTPFMGGNTTYLTAVFTDVSTNHVDLTLTPNLPIGGPTNADIDDIAFNMSPFITDLSATGPNGFTYKVAADAEKISSYKKLDILLDEGQGYAHSILKGTTPITIHLMGTTPTALTASIFNATNTSGVYAVAKIQTASGSYESTSNGPPDTQSAAPLPPAAPLPATVAGGASLMVMVMFSQVRRMRQRRLA